MNEPKPFGDSDFLMRISPPTAMEVATANVRAQFANAAEDVIRACAQFVPSDAMSAVASLERLCDLAGVPRKLLDRCLQ